MRENQNIFRKILLSILFTSTAALTGCGPKTKQDMRGQNNLSQNATDPSKSDTAGSDEGADVHFDLSDEKLQNAVEYMSKAMLTSHGQGKGQDPKAPSPMLPPLVVAPGPDGKVSEQDMLRLGFWICSWKLDALLELAKRLNGRELRALMAADPQTGAQVAVLQPLVKGIKLKHLKRITSAICPLIVIPHPNPVAEVVLNPKDSATIPPNVKVD